mmetsp:Transcript_40291/g.126045  ORF Transcript_40291/g.126045 Transcript_40291/m.126045 type:complete len:549 (-) Transcript_40291:72-1718(-)
MEAAGETPASRAALRYVLTAAAVAALTATTLGYDVGIMADAALYVKDDFDLTDGLNELIIGSLNFISAFGALLGGPAADAFGRRPSVWICCALYLVGTALMAAAPNWGILLLGRVVTGLGVGVAFTVCPVYVAELAPAELRGRLTTLFDISINGGILVGYVVGYICDLAIQDPAAKWRTMLALGAVPPLVVIFFLGLLPESPRYLIMRGRLSDALDVLTKTLGSEGLARDEFESIMSAIGGGAAAAKPTADDVKDAAAASDDEDDLDLSLTPSATQEPATWEEILFPRTRVLQRALFIVMGLAFWQQATGSEAVLYYSATFLREAGLKSRGEMLLGNIGLGFCKLFPECLSLLYVDALGRTRPLIFSSLWMTASITCLGLAYALGWGGVVVVLLLCSFMFGFSVAIGPFTWVVAAELLSMRYRAKGTMLGIFLNRLTSGTVALSALSTADALGYPTFFFLYAAVSVVSVGFYMSCVPETAGRTLEETEAMLEQMPPLEFCPCDAADTLDSVVKGGERSRTGSAGSGRGSSYRYSALNEDEPDDHLNAV